MHTKVLKRAQIAFYGKQFDTKKKYETNLDWTQLQKNKKRSIAKNKIKINCKKIAMHLITSFVMLVLI